MTLKLLPRPRCVEAGDGTFDLAAQDTIQVSNNAEALAGIIAAEWQAETDRPITISLIKCDKFSFSIGANTEIAAASSTHAEAYRLEINSDGVAAAANTYGGLVHAWQTLKQIMRHDTRTLPCLRIDDQPDVRWRIYHVDMKATRRTVPNLHAILPQLAELKVNAILAEYEDYIQLDRHPELAIPGALSKGEIRAWVAAAATYGIAVIPLVQTLGHWQYILNRPEYEHLQEREGNTTTACPSQAQTWELATDFLDEMMEVHDSAPYIHVGLDEAFHLGVCPHCKNIIGDRRPIDLFTEWADRICRYVIERGFEAMMWGDMIEPLDRDMAETLNRDVTYVDWGYTHANRDYPWLRLHSGQYISKEWLKRPNGPARTPPLIEYRIGAKFFEDLPGDQQKQLQPYIENESYPDSFRFDLRLAWLKELGLKRGGVSGIRVSFHGKVAPRFIRGQMNTRAWADACREHGADVMIGSSWSRGHSFASTNAHPELDFYGIATLGDAGWSPLADTEMRDFDQRFGFQFFGVDDNRIGDLYYLFERSSSKADDVMDDFYEYVQQACRALLPQVTRNRDRFELFAAIVDMQILRLRTQFAVVEMEYFYQTWAKVPPAFKQDMFDRMDDLEGEVSERIGSLESIYGRTLIEADAKELAASQLLFVRDNMMQMRALMMGREGGDA